VRTGTEPPRKLPPWVELRVVGKDAGAIPEKHQNASRPVCFRPWHQDYITSREIKLVKPCFRAVLAWEGILLCVTVQNLEREGIDVEVVRTKL
jgi:hypothetical protein